jgi:exonuclease 1
MAYLEKRGLVSAILTEDSDLLVFGCKNVLFKLDTVAQTVTSISRADFSSVSASSGDSAGCITLTGWTDAQFRCMAILSGCDYLTSIPGIGLKTAYTLLRKHKTADRVIKFLLLEGKKNVPREYRKMFGMAEKCFLFQRVWDPVEGKLVNLCEVEEGVEEWDEECDVFVGG